VPDEAFFNKEMDSCIKDLKIFGTPVMCHVPKEKRKKWDKKSQKLVFVGYDDSSKGYRCIERETGKLHVVRDAIFLEPPESGTVSFTNDDDDNSLSTKIEPKDEPAHAILDTESDSEEAQQSAESDDDHGAEDDDRGAEGDVHGWKRRQP